MNSNEYQKILSLLGIARKSGNISSGAEAVMVSLKKNQAKLLIMSEDIAENRKEALLQLCRENKIKWLIIGSKDELGAALGQSQRVAVTVNDAGMAQAVWGKIGKLRELESLGVDEWQK